MIPYLKSRIFYFFSNSKIKPTSKKLMACDYTNSNHSSVEVKERRSSFSQDCGP